MLGGQGLLKKRARDLTSEERVGGGDYYALNPFRTVGTGRLETKKGGEEDSDQI